MSQDANARSVTLKRKNGDDKKEDHKEGQDQEKDLKE